MTINEEEKYFQQIELERLKAKQQALKQAADELARARRVGEIVGSSDEAVTTALRKLHFDEDSARVFDLLPLVHVAWADGSVSRAERKTIFDLVEKRGIAADSQAYLTIAALLDERPTDAFLDETLVLLNAIAQAQGHKAVNVVDMCVQVAQASGGFFGLTGNGISDDERALIAKIADSLGAAAQSAFERKANA